MKQHDIKKMHRLYEQWQSCGLSNAAFCRQQGIRNSTFHYWVKKFGQAGVPTLENPQRKGFFHLPVQPVIAAQHQQALAVINFPSGIRLELFCPLEAPFLKDLVQ
ncbi:hypothetical protein BH24BAC1_BH24BAC1_39760 [soil metagenome]